MAGKPGVLDPLEVAITHPALSQALEDYRWLARSDRIWSKAMTSYHLVTEDELWLVLLQAAKGEP